MVASVMALILSIIAEYSDPTDRGIVGDGGVRRTDRYFYETKSAPHTVEWLS
jgi:hypothetical protein